MATSATLDNGTRVELTVGPPWWSWIYAGLVYQPGNGTVKATRVETRIVRHWWCFWLCSSEERVTVDARVDRIAIAAMGASATGDPTGGDANSQALIDLGTTICNNCTELTHWSHQFGFPFPPWLGGGFKGVGYRASIEVDGDTVTLRRHWSSVGGDPLARLILPPDFQT